MRLPVAGNISTKDGASNKNSRLTNMLAEQKKNGQTLATVRPGLSAVVQTTGEGNGVACFNGEIVCLFGDQITAGMYAVPPSADVFDSMLPKPIDRLINNNGIWYAFLYMGYSGHATIGGIWSSSDLTTWSEITSSRQYYIIGAPFLVGDTIYCSMARYDTGVRYRVTISSGGSVSYDAVAASNFIPLVYQSGYFYGTEAVVAGMSYTIKFARSPDLDSVTTGDDEPHNQRPIYGMTYGGGRFWVANYIVGPGDCYLISSTDGLTWTSETIVHYGATWPAVPYFQYGNDELVIIVFNHGLPFCYKTNDGVTIDGTSITISDSDYQGLVYNPSSSKYYLVGGYVADGYDSTYFAIMESDDAVDWQELVAPSVTGPHINPISYEKFGLPSQAINGDSFVCGLVIYGPPPYYTPVTYGALGVSALRYELSDVSSLQNARVDFALIP